MKQFNYFFYLLFLTLCGPALAYNPSSGNVSAVLGPYMYKTNFSSSESGAISPILGGYGLMAVGDVNDKGSLEIAMFDMHKLYIRNQDGLFISEEKEVIHITMGYRWWLSSYLSTSLTFYSSYSLGLPKIVHSDFPAGAAIDTSARDTTEYGFDLALQDEIWSEGHYAVVADLRYSLSVTSKKDEKSDHYGLFLGIRYLVQGK